MGTKRTTERAQARAIKKRLKRWANVLGLWAFPTPALAGELLLGG